jgi:hypothetical protein
MQARISTLPRRTLIKRWGGCLLLAAVAGWGSVAEAAKAQLNSKIPAGKWKAVRLRRLPAGASLSVKVEASASLVVILVHESEIKRYPAAIHPAFQGTLERTLSFGVVVPDAGDYYLIFDNRRGADERRVRILIQATAPKSRDARPKDGGAGGESI